MPGFDVPLGDGKQAGQASFGGEEIVAVRIQPIGRNGKTDGQEFLVRFQQKAEIHLQREAAAQGFDVVQKARIMWAGQIGKMIGKCRMHGRGPERRLGERVAGQGHGALHRARQRGQGGFRVRRCRRNRCKITDQVEVLCMGPERAAGKQGAVTHRLPHDAIIRRGLGAPGAAGLRHCDQVPGKVSAVHRGHVGRVKHAQVAGVVPVVKVAAKAGHALDRLQRIMHPLQGRPLAYPSHIMRRDGGQEIEPDVGGRRPGGDDRSWDFLEVVRGQEIVLWRDEGFEIPPGPPGNQPQFLRLRGGEGRSRRLHLRQADRAGNCGRHGPE